MADALAKYPENFFLCRDMHHAWSLYAWFEENHEVHRVLVCERCDTEREDRWLRNGERVGAVYRYPDGYRIEGGVEAYEVRLAAISHAHVYPSWEAAQAALRNGGKK